VWSREFQEVKINAKKSHSRLGIIQRVPGN